MHRQGWDVPEQGGSKEKDTGLFRLLRHGVVAVVAAAAVLVAVAAWSFLVSRAEERALRNAELLQSYMLRLIETQETVLAAADEATRQMRPFSEADPVAYRAAADFLNRLVQRIGEGEGLAFLDADNTLVLQTDNAPPADAFGLYGDLHRVVPDDGLYVDRMVIEPHGIDALMIARQSRNLGGPPGLWVSTIEIDAVRAFLRQIATGSEDAASVVREDGLLLVRNLPLTAPLSLDQNQPLMRTIATSGGGIYHARAQSDGVYRFYATTRVGTYPLFATAGIARGTVLREWMIVAAFAAAAFGTIGVLGWHLVNMAERRMRAEEAEAASRFDRRLLAEAKKTADFRETMLRELNHRVKNSLQMIGALIQLQRSRPEGPDLDEVVARVQAIASIHDLLYRSASAFDADFAILLHQIARSQAIAPPESGFVVDVDAEPMPLDVGVATPLALCAVELITNAAKHAYGGGGGRVAVTLHHTQAGEAALVVADTGSGMPDSGVRKRRSGLRVVEELVRQLDGSLTVERHAGTRFEIRFPVTGAAEATEQHDRERDGREQRHG